VPADGAATVPLPAGTSILRACSGGAQGGA